MRLSTLHGKLSGQMVVPGSKAHTIRALAVAMAARGGTSTIKAPLVCEDTISSLTAASTLGAWVKRGDDSIWRITGTGGHFLEPVSAVDMDDSGTGMKIFAAMASLAPFTTRFDGNDALRSRPVGPLLEALAGLGVTCRSENGRCPFTVQGPFKGGETEVDARASMYLSALLFAAPLAKADTVIKVKNLSERPSVELTLQWLKDQGIKLSYDDDLTKFVVKGNQYYEPFTFKIPGDFSVAAFPLAAGAITGSEVKLRNLDFKDAQGGRAIMDYLSAMGAKIEAKGDHVTIGSGTKLTAVELDMNATPNLLPIMAVTAAFAKGRSVFRNVARARDNESDRIDCMADALSKMGVKVEQFDDGLAVTGGKVKPARVESRHDTRVAMALAVAGFGAEESDETMIVEDADCITSKYPTFIDDMRSLGATIYEL